MCDHINFAIPIKSSYNLRVVNGRTDGHEANSQLPVELKVHVHHSLLNLIGK